MVMVQNTIFIKKITFSCISKRKRKNILIIGFCKIFVCTTDFDKQIIVKFADFIFRT